MSVLWAVGESSVRDIQQRLAQSRPRAYTTVLTIMDRLAQKGIASRRKLGRAFLYQAKLSAEEARLKAVEKIIDHFFDGSAEALAALLSSHHGAVREIRPANSPAVDAPGTTVAKLPAQNPDKTLL